jgi:hypothetical protein
MLDACLRPNPSERPLGRDVLDITARTLLELGVCCEVLGVWTEHARSLPGNRPSSVAAWSSPQLAAVSPENLREEIGHLEARLAACDGPRPSGIEITRADTSAESELEMINGHGAAPPDPGPRRRHLRRWRAWRRRGGRRRTVRSYGPVGRAEWFDPPPTAFMGNTAWLVSQHYCPIPPALKVGLRRRRRRA